MKYASLRQGLVGAWCPSLGATGYRLLDRSGYNNHGTLTNMGAGAGWIGNPYGTVLDFDGANDFVTMGTQAANFAGPISVSVWVRKAILQSPGSNSGIIAKGNIVWTWPASYCMSLLGSSPENVVSWAVFDEANNGRIGYYSADGIAARVWTHVVGTYNGTGTTNAATKLYIQGKLKSILGSEDAGTFISMTVTTAPLEIGRRQNTSFFEYANIQIDDIRIYNRVLTESEIKTLSIKPGIGLRPERVSVYFDESLSSRRRKILTGLT